MGSQGPRDGPVQELAAEIRRRFSEFEGSDELPSEAAIDLCVWLLTHERIMEALDEVRGKISQYEG